MSASHNRGYGDQSPGSGQYLMGWEKQVLLGLMRVCMESPTGQSSIDCLRDELIQRFPQVLPDLKQKYGKFTALLKAHGHYFQINPFDRTVKLMAIHPDLIAAPSSHSERNFSSTSIDTSNSSSSTYSNPSLTRETSTYSDRSYSSSSASTAFPNTRSRAVYTQPTSLSTSPDVALSPRSHGNTVGRRASSQPFSGFHGPSPSSSSTSLPLNNPNLVQSSNPPPKNVSFSSLEQWEQMTVFAVLKHLIHTSTGFEHYITLQDRLNDPQLLAKYSSLLDLLRLFPGNFLIDAKGYVSLLDPVKARAQYPTLAAEFERRISAPQAPVLDPTSHLTVAFNNATSPWEKALLKTVWTLLMSQTNHAANFPWLTTQLTRFKPWVKQNFGSLRLWAIQQTLFKFQGDTIYIPAHVAPSSSASGMNATAPGTMGSGVPGPPPPAPPLHRPMNANSSFAPVSSANFSIPVPPALPQRRASTNTSQTAPNAVAPPLAGPIASKTFQPWTDVRDNWGYAQDEMNTRSRGRQPVAPAASGHKRQRSASPSSIRQIGNLAPYSIGPSSHHRSQSSTTDDLGAPPPVRFGYGPPPNTMNATTNMPPLHASNMTAAVPVNIPKLNLQTSSPVSSNASSGSTSHPFMRKTSASLENSRGNHLEGTSSSTVTGANATNASKEKETVVLAAQPTSPRRLTPHPLHSIDKEIPNLSQVPLVVNRANVAIKVVQSVEEVRKVVSFLSTFSSISVSVETGEFESNASSQRRSRMSQDMIHSPIDHETGSSHSSAKSVRIASSPSGGDLSATEVSSLVIGSAPSHTTTNPLLESRPSMSSQDDMVVLGKGEIGGIGRGDGEVGVGSGVGIGIGGVGGGGGRREIGVLGGGRNSFRLSNNRNVASVTTHHLHLDIPQSSSHIQANNQNSGGVNSSSSGRYLDRELDDHIPIIHEGREDSSSFSNPTHDIVLMCLSARTTHGNSPHAPSSTLAGHSDKDLFKSHPVFVFDLRQHPKFYRYLRPLLQSSSTLKIVYNCPSLSDLLYTQHGIHLSNILEIQVLHRLLWEISTLPMRFTHATGLETTLTHSEEISKSSDSHGPPSKSSVSFGGGPLYDSIGSAKSGSFGTGINSYGAKGLSGSHSSIVKSPPSDRHSAVNITTTTTTTTNNNAASSHLQGHASSSNAHHHNPSHYPAQPPIPSMDAPLGQLLQYFGITLGGITVPEKHPLLDAVETNISGTSIRSALWPVISISPASLLRIAAVCATLLDLRILLATQLSVSFSKTMLQISQGYSHAHLPEFQNAYTTGNSLNPLSQDQWIDAPELFSHLSE